MRRYASCLRAPLLVDASTTSVHDMFMAQSAEAARLNPCDIVSSCSAPGALGVVVNGASLELLPEGAIWWPEARLLAVSDLHLGKASSYAVKGQMLPPYDARATLAAVAALVDRLQPDTVISLGDSFHDKAAQSRLDADDIAAIRRLTGRCDWWWIEGNHDPVPPKDLGGRAGRELRLDMLTFRHEPLEGPRPGEVCGHLHPAAKVAGKSGRNVRTRCFATDGQRLVMPALGALTGGLNVLDNAFAPCFPQGLLAAALGRDGVYVVAQTRLVADGASGASRWRL